MDTRILAKNLKERGIFLLIFKGIPDTLINFRDMGIQCIPNLRDICHIYFRDMEYFSKQLKGYGKLGPPFQGLTNIGNYFLWKMYRAIHYF